VSEYNDAISMAKVKVYQIDIPLMQVLIYICKLPS